MRKIKNKRIKRKGKWEKGNKQRIKRKKGGNKPQVKQQQNPQRPMLYIYIYIYIYMYILEGNKLIQVKVSEVQEGIIIGVGNCKQGLPMKSLAGNQAKTQENKPKFCLQQRYSHFSPKNSLHS